MINQKNARAIRKFMKSMGMDYITHRSMYKKLKKTYKEGINAKS